MLSGINFKRRTKLSLFISYFLREGNVDLLVHTKNGHITFILQRTWKGEEVKDEFLKAVPKLFANALEELQSKS